MKLCVFDFDGTLVNTLNKPQSNKEALQAGWNGRDWWGSKCSLDSFDFHENVYQAFVKARNDPDSKAVVLTGRRGVIAWRIREILREAGCPGRRMIPDSNKLAWKHFHDRQEQEDKALHEEYFTGDFTTEDDYPKGKKNKPIDNTLTYKTFIIEQRLMNKDVTELHIWDDRKDHFGPMLDLAESLIKKWPTLKRAVIHQVFPEPSSFSHIAHVTQPNVADHVLNNTSKSKKDA